MSGVQTSRERRRRSAADRAARRGASSGSGPVRREGPVAAFPGATSWFALLGEVLLTGIIVTVLAIGVVTLPAALVVGARHLGRYVRAEQASVSSMWSDLRQAGLGGLGVGSGAVVLAAACLFDFGLATADGSVVGLVMRAIGVLGLVILVVALVVVAARWTPAGGWIAAVGGLRAALDDDPAGAGLIALVVGFVALASWQSPPLFVPAIGCLVLAMVAVPVRSRRRRDRAGRR